MMRYLLFCLCLFSEIQAFCQIGHPALLNFTAFQFENTVVLQWTMKPGNTCFGTGILRSVDFGEFEDIGLITGICGDSDIALSYSFVDSFPVKNVTSRYKLVLGILGESQIVTIQFFDFNSSQAIVAPNPFRGHGIIYYPSSSNFAEELRLYDGNGILKLIRNINNENPIILSNLLNASCRYGQYFFSIHQADGKTISRGTFVYIE